MTLTDKTQHEYGYMCKIDFDYELGSALGGNKIFPHISDLVHNHKCCHSCGIVKVKVSLEEVLHKTDHSNNRKEENKKAVELLITNEQLERDKID